MHHTMTLAALARTVTSRRPAVAVKSDVKTGHDIAYVTRGHASGCAGAMVYYTRTGDPPGTWDGRGTAALGVSGKVQAEVAERRRAPVPGRGREGPPRLRVAQPAGPQARAEGPDPARTRRAPPRAHRHVRRGPGREAVPVRERQPAPAVHLVAGVAEGPAASLTPEQLATPLMKRPYDLRHSGVTWRLNSGVPATEVAAWAGHSVEVLTRIYARCTTGLEDVWISRMDGTLHLEDRERR